MLRLSNHVPVEHIQRAIHMGRLAQDTQMSLTISLNFQNQAVLDELLVKIYDPKDAQFGKYLSSFEFNQNFLPSPQDVQAVKDYLLVQGIQIQEQVGNTLRISGSAHNIEMALATEFHQYQVAEPNGSQSQRFAASQEPLLRSDIAAKVSGIVGLHNFSNFSSHAQIHAANAGIGTGPNGGMSPSDILKAYSISGSADGQSLALMELDGYNASDIALYANQFGLVQTPLMNILVDGFSGAAGAGAIEVALDIEMMMAVAPTATKIMVYEGPNTDQGVLDTYARIANDNIAKQASTSWGAPEAQSTSAFLQAENLIFKQMAAQGQSIFAASGDFGAFDDQRVLGVDDPASQPFVTGAGGTTLSLNADGSFRSESSWGTLAGAGAGAPGGRGAGGGISGFWPIQNWQIGFGNTSNRGSQTMRMVPDISGNANPASGYSVAINNSFTVVGGTSAVSPIYAAITAIVNSARAKAGNPPLGFANPSLYQLGQSSIAGQVFRDIADNSTNLSYPATMGYDLSTGLGSINSMLFLSLINPILPPMPPGGLAATAHNTSVNLNWAKPTGAVSYLVYRATSAAGPFAMLVSNLANLSFADTGLQNGVTYFYYVVAADASGKSGQSGVASATPQLIAPQAPVNLVLTPITGI